MCILPKIFHSAAKSTEGLLYIGAPVFGIEPVFKLLPFVGITKAAAGSGKHKLSLFVEGIQHGKIFSFEFIPEHCDRNKKGFL